VGYGKPPARSRFQKGKSGNPGGSSRKQVDDVERTKEIILTEAYRPVPVREGDKVSKVPAIAAIFHAQMAIVLKGNGPAQRAILQTVTGFEAEKRALFNEYLKAMIEYKVGAEREIARRRALGIIDISDIQPHPDDILIDVSGGEGLHKRPQSEGHRDPDEARDQKLRAKGAQEAPRRPYH
jgi:hypothetical protein